MRFLILGASALALLAPAAHAQQTSNGVAPSQQVAPGEFVVFFPFDSSQLNADARRVIADAAESYRQTGQASVTLTGHTDTVGSSSYNLELSQRRAEAVQNELVRLGVPFGSIQTIPRGQEDLLVPTGDEVREPRNRAVVINVPQPPPAPVAAEPVQQVEAAPEPEPEPDRFTFAIGPVYGHNFGESDQEGGDKTENDMVGAELTFRALPGFLGGVSLKQMVLWPFNAIDEDLTGRSVASLDFAPDLGIFRPTLAVNAGGVYGGGVQDGFVVGPEIRFDIAPVGGFNIGLKAAYDYQFRNTGWDEGIGWAGLDLGFRW